MYNVSNPTFSGLVYHRPSLIESVILCCFCSIFLICDFFKFISKCIRLVHLESTTIYVMQVYQVDYFFFLSILFMLGNFSLDTSQIFVLEYRGGFALLVLVRLLNISSGYRVFLDFWFYIAIFSYHNWLILFTLLLTIVKLFYLENRMLRVRL